jgi:hypothetical protein
MQVQRRKEGFQARQNKTRLSLLAITQVFVTLLAAVCISATADGAGTAALPTEASGLYSLSNIWTVHLKFTPEQWTEMEPKGGDGPFGGF